MNKLGYIALEIFFISSLVGKEMFEIYYLSIRFRYHCLIIIIVLGALFFTISLWILNGYRRGLLNMTPGDRMSHQQSLL